MREKTNEHRRLNKLAIWFCLKRWTKFVDKYNKRIPQKSKDILRADEFSIIMSVYALAKRKWALKLEALDEEYKIAEYDKEFDKIANKFQKDDRRIEKQYHAKKYEKAKSELENWFYERNKAAADFNPEYRKKIRKLIRRYHAEKYDNAKKKRREQFRHDKDDLELKYRLEDYTTEFRRIDRTFYHVEVEMLNNKYGVYPRPSDELRDKWFKIIRLYDPEYEEFCMRIIEIYASIAAKLNIEDEKTVGIWKDDEKNAV